VSHRTTVWATLHVQTGSVRYIDLEGPFPRDVRLVAGDSSVIQPGVEHYVEPSTDAKFFIQFYREPGADMIPGQVPDIPHRRSGPWQHRGRDLDTPRRGCRSTVRRGSAGRCDRSDPPPRLIRTASR
jgi:hypothetical protein